MKSEIALRKRAIALHLQGWNKSEIARKVQRWIGRYEPEAPTTSLQNHSRAPTHIPWAYRERRSRKAPNPTYPVLPCQVVNDVQELDFKGPLYLKDHSHKYYRMVLRDKVSSAG